jgi:hypothetical protein
MREQRGTQNINQSYSKSGPSDDDSFEGGEERDDANNWNQDVPMEGNMPKRTKHQPVKKPVVAAKKKPIATPKKKPAIVPREAED